MWRSLIIIILVLPAAQSTDTCMNFRGNIEEDLTRQNQKGAFDCSITLPCQQDLVSVSMIEIVLSEESKTRYVTILRDGETVEGSYKSEAAGSLDKSGTSYLNVKFPLDNITSDTVYMDCIVRGLRGLNTLKESIVMSKSLKFKTSTCKKENASETFYCKVVFTYNGNKYCLSKDVGNSELAAINFCNSVGGYLAEIEDINEYHAIQAEVRLTGVKSVVIGGTDKADEGTWIYQHSQRPVKFFDWPSTEPNNGGNEDCLEIGKSFNYRMNDIPCYFSNYGASNFLCELNK